MHTSKRIDVGAFCEHCQTSRNVEVYYIGTGHKASREKTYECKKCGESWYAVKS